MNPERLFGIGALILMSALPAADFLARLAGGSGVPGSTAVVQVLTVWVALLGAAQAAAADRLLSLSANTFLPARWAPPVRIFTSSITAAVAICLAWACLQLVIAERAAGAELAFAIPRWTGQAIMPAAFLIIALRAVWSSGFRAIAAVGLIVPALLYFIPAANTSPVLWIGLFLLAASSLLGSPIYVTLGGLALLLFYHAAVPIASVGVEMYRLVASPVLPCLPLFTFAGYILVEGGASRRLLRVYTALFGWLPGGLAITTAVVCAIFTFAGSGVTILSMGGLLLPMLMKAHYSERFSIGLINGSGSLGLLFPPSLPLILYGVYARTPIDELFIAGFLPGLLMVVMVAAYGVLHAVRHDALRARFSVREAWSAIYEGKWELALPVIVLVGLFGGFGTLTEAGAITVVYAVLVEGLTYRALTWKAFKELTTECLIVVGGVLTIVGVAVGLTNYLVDAEVPRLLIDWTRAHVHSKYVFLLMLNVLLLIKGSFMDVFSAIIVLVPLITPLAAEFGIPPVQLGILFLANLELGYLTPPVGINLCLSAYRFQQPIASIYRSTVPFYVILFAGVLLVTYVPALTLMPLEWWNRIFG